MNKFRATKLWSVFAVFSLLVIFSSCKDEIDIRDAHVGTYSGVETFINGGIKTTRNVTIVVSKASESDNKLLLSGKFYGQDEVVESSISSDGSFTFSYTTNMDDYSTTVTGYNGKIKNGTISYSYSAQDYVTIDYSGTRK